MQFINLAEIFAPMQIIVVLVLALILFGPNKLPELGKQLGSAIRDLNKAKNDLLKQVNLDHEPDHEPYNSTYMADSQPTTDYNYNYDNYSPTPSQPDLTDYTIAGVPPKVRPAEHTVAYGGAPQYDEARRAAESADYMFAPAPRKSSDAEAGAHSA
jgi:sec-independent protein translocase protein TatA